MITSLTQLYAFLKWKIVWKVSSTEQGKFKEDAINFPGVLDFGVMWPKSPYIHLVHSIEMYPNAPGNDPAWKGKTIWFLGDCTSYSPAPQMIKLKEKAPWMWGTHSICTDLTEVDVFYANDKNADKSGLLGLTPQRLMLLCQECW